MRFMLVCASLLAVAAGSANAAVVTVSTSGHPLGSNSKLNISLNLAGLQTINVNNITLSGYEVVNYSLNPSYTGTIDVTGGDLTLANVNQSFGSAFDYLQGSIKTNNVHASLLLNNQSVTNGNFNIDSSSVGSLDLNQGSLQLTLTGGLLYSVVTGVIGSNSISIDLTADPVSVDFAGLGTSSAPAYADNNLPGGTNPNGSELDAGLGFMTTTDLSGLTVTITTTGNVYLGGAAVPEFGSLGFASLAAAGLGGVAAFRRRRASV